MTSQVIRILITWVVTFALRKMFGKHVKMESLSPYVAYIVSLIMNVIGGHLGVIDPTPVDVVIDAGLANSFHSLIKPIRKALGG